MSVTFLVIYSSSFAMAELHHSIFIDPTCPRKRGHGTRAVNLLDVQPFIDLLSSGEFSNKADINEDGEVNLLDVAPFVTILSGG